MIEEEYYNRYTRNCIYLAICSENSKIYIGKTEQILTQRIRLHQNSIRNSPFYFKNKTKNCAFDKILWQVIFAMPNQGKLTEIEKIELSNKEIECIELYKSRNPNIGYNVAIGGYGKNLHHILQIE